MSAPSINNAGGHPLSAFAKLKVCPDPHLHTHSFNEHCHRYKKNDNHDMGIHQVFEYTVWWHDCYLDSLAANRVICLGGLFCQVHISHQEKCKHVSNFLHELESRHRLSYALRLWKILFFFFSLLYPAVFLLHIVQTNKQPHNLAREVSRPDTVLSQSFTYVIYSPFLWHLHCTWENTRTQRDGLWGMEKHYLAREYSINFQQAAFIIHNIHLT